MKRRLQTGFTLVEMAVVLVIIGLIIGGILEMGSIHQSAQAKDVISMVGDISAAASSFKENYKYLPGDFPAAANEIANVNALCVAGGANAGDGNGAISALESACVPEHLFRAGLVRATLNAASGLYELRGALGGVVSVMGFGLSRAGVAGYAGMPTVLNVTEVPNLPCDIALEIDRKMDNGDLTTGNIVAVDATPAVNTCTPGGANDPVPFLDVALN